MFNTTNLTSCNLSYLLITNNNSKNDDTNYSLKQFLANAIAYLVIN